MSTSRIRTVLTTLAAPVALIGGLILTGMAATPAAAASGDVIRELDIAIEVDAEGLAHVTETYTWDFGSREGLGFTRILDARFDHPPVEGMDRVYRYDDVSAASASDGPAEVWTSEDGPRLRIDVGAPDGSDDTRSGVQTYELSYTITGALNAIRDQPGVDDQDELYWNATGDEWEIPIESATVRVTGPAEVVDAACYAGRDGEDSPCDDLGQSAETVTASSGRLEPGEGLTVMAAFPAGAFADIDPILEPSQDEGAGNPPAWVIFATVVGGVAVALGSGAVRARRHRDLAFTQVAPGVVPRDPASAPVAPLASNPPVAVRFTPPDGLRPAEVGMIRTAAAHPRGFTATIVDLAVAGFLRIEEIDHDKKGKATDWRLVATGGGQPEALRDYERELLGALFAGASEVKISSLSGSLAGTRSSVLRTLTRSGEQMGLFVPRRVQGSLGWVAALGLMVAAGGAVLGATVAGLPVAIPAAVVITGVALFCVAIAALIVDAVARQRTAYGRALYEQTRGFELYLTTAEANQLRWEEGEDIFSRYLPYAIVFGVAERWAGIFEQLAEQGRYDVFPVWYVATGGFHRGAPFTAMSQSIGGFTSTTTASLSATSGSSGASGSFGGGGGFAGGGGGGGGGGGR